MTIYNPPPRAFMHANIDNSSMYAWKDVCLEGPMVELLTRVDPNKYRTYMIEERGKMVLYEELQKALYSMVQAAFMFW